VITLTLRSTGSRRLPSAIFAPSSPWRSHRKASPKLPSLWENVQKGTHDAVMHRRWPDPFRNAMKNINVLACEDTWQADVTMWTITAMNFWWSNFFPSPVEVVRKTVSGGYKCGFFFKVLKFRSPIDIIWRDQRTSRALLQISRPATTALFYWWATQTLYEGLNTFDSLILAGEFCDRGQNESLMRDSSALFTTVGHKEGAPAFGEVIYDPQDRCNPAITLVEYHSEAIYDAHAYGYFVSLSASMTNNKVAIDTGVGAPVYFEFPDCLPFETVAFDVHVQGQNAGPVLQVNMQSDISGGALLKARWVCTRFTCFIGPTPQPPTNFPVFVDEPDKPENFCDAFSPPYI